MSQAVWLARDICNNQTEIERKLHKAAYDKLELFVICFNDSEPGHRKNSGLASRLMMHQARPVAGSLILPGKATKKSQATALNNPCNFTQS